MPEAILIRGGRVIDPARAFDETADMLLTDGVIQQISTKPGAIDGKSINGVTIIDADGCIVCPGLLDIHVHLREPSMGTLHRETIASGSASALNGGFTTVCCMPNTNPPLDSAVTVEFIHARAAQADGARIRVVGCASKGRRGEEQADIGSMANAGAVAFSDDGEVVADAGLMQKVLRTVKAHDRVFMQHCQEPALTRGGVMNAGALATKLGLGGWPAIAEEIIIERDVRINRDIGCRYHAQHISSGDSIEILERAQKDGQPVTGEVAPHHLLLTEDACAEYDTNAKMNPPLRAQRDINQLREAVARGIITILATDHAPHPPETKNADFTSASFGIVGLDCALPLYARALIEEGVLDWPQMLTLMTINSARLVGLESAGAGMLTPQLSSDVTIIDTNMAWTIDVADFRTTARNCPFHGWKVRSRAVAAVVGGRLRMQRLGDRLRQAVPKEAIRAMGPVA